MLYFTFIPSKKINFLAWWFHLLKFEWGSYADEGDYVLNTILFFSRVHRARGAARGPQSDAILVSSRESYVRRRSGRGRGEEGHREEESPDEEEAVPSAAKAEPHEPPSRPHRRVSFPFARAHEEKKKKKKTIREPDFFDWRTSGTFDSTRKKSAATMVYESDFYTTRRPYSRPLASSYTVTVSILELFFAWKRKSGLEVCLNNVFATRGKLTSRKRESPVCDRKCTHPP